MMIFLNYVKRGVFSNTSFSLLRSLIGFVFIFSAITKLITIDFFEIYVYSLNLASFNISTILARLLIAGEFGLGLFFIVGIWTRFAWYASLSLLTAFTLFLCIQVFKGSEQNCLCFGDLIKMTPKESIIKNVLMLLAIFPLYHLRSCNLPFKKKWPVFIILVSLAIPFIISPPDYFIQNKVNTINTKFILPKHTYHQNGQEVIFDSLNFNKGRKLLCVYSTQCGYCKKGAIKIEIMARKYHFNNEMVILFGGQDNEVDDFFKSTELAPLNYLLTDLLSLVKLTQGHFPRFYLIENGKVLNVYGYRDISEKNLALFFNNAHSLSIN